MKFLRNSVIGLFFICLASILHSCEKEVPTLTTCNVTNITATTATCGGNVISAGSGHLIHQGVCWSTNITPTINDYKTQEGYSYGSFSSNIWRLNDVTTYYIRAYATNEAGTGYGKTVSFKTLEGLHDIDGNIYNTVLIGTQTWLVENMKTTRYNDGTSIPLVTDNFSWSKLTTPGYCSLNNDTNNKEFYGAIYNWYTVNTASNGGKNVCLTGWHVSTDAEWTTLITYLGGDLIAGGKLKATGNLYWDINMATNESGFTALPGGFRNDDGSFGGWRVSSRWWTSTEYNSCCAGCWYMADGAYWIYHREDGCFKNSGSYVRCIKD